MSKRKESLPIDINSKKTKTENKRKRTPTNKNDATPQEPSNLEIFREILNKLDTIDLNSNEITEIISSIIKRNGITSRQDETILSIFKKMIHKQEFDSEMFLFMLDQLNNEFLTKHKNLCDLLISSLFMIQTDVKVNTPPSTSSLTRSLKLFKFKPSQFNDLIKHAFNLINLTNFTKQSLVYMKLFKLFVNVDFRNEKYLKDKSLFVKAEKILLEKLADRLKLDPTGSIGNEVFKTFKSLVTEYSIKALNNNFIIKVYFTIINELGDKISNNIMEELLKLIESGFEVQSKSNKSYWIQKCLYKSIETRKLVDLFNYNNLVQFIPQDKLITNTIEFCMAVFNKYGVEINQYFAKPTSVQQYFTLLASKIIQELFRKSKPSRELILNALLNRSFTESNRLVFISQLEILLNSEDASRIFYSNQNQEEKSNLCKLAISKLIGKSSTKTRAWNHIFLIDKSNDALRLLKSFRVMFYTANKQPNTENFESLVSFLRSYSNNSSIEIRKIALLGLANLVVELNRDHFPKLYHDYKVSHDVCLTQNSAISLNIIEHLKTQLASFETDVSLKSKLYQTLYASIECVKKQKTIQNDAAKLFDAIGGLFRSQLETYIIRTTNSDYCYFNLNKCISNDFKLTEPIDILFHCADLFSTHSLKLIASGNLAFRTLSNVLFQVTQLKKVYLEKDSKFLFDIYKTQLMEKIKVQQSPAACMKILHQLQLGFIDVLLEHSVNNEYYNDLKKILEKYESTSNLISIEIENLMTSIHKQAVLESKTSKTETTKKRKLEQSVSATQKKAKKTSCIRRAASQHNVNESSDKENEPAPKTRSGVTTRSIRETLQDLSNKTNNKSSEVQAKPTISVIQNLSFANIQFEHVHRISFDCCLKMTQMYLGTNESDIFKSTGTRVSLSVLGTLLNLITNETFIEFLIKVMEKKLKLLSQDSYSEEYYDPQSRTDEQIFKFMSSLWLALCQRINGNLTAKKSVYKQNIPQKFGVQFLNKSHRFIQCLQMIWSVSCKKFNSMLKELIVNERKYYTNSSFNSHFVDENDSKLTEIYWEFIKNCSRTLKYHLNPTPTTQTIANKCSLALLTLISDIHREIKLKSENSDQLMQFLFDLADHKISHEQDFGACVIKLLTNVAESSNTSVIISKILSMDYSNKRYLNHSDDSDDERDPIDETSNQFELYNNDTSFVKYQQIMNDQILNCFDKFKWCLSHSQLFNEDLLIKAINSQIDMIILSINNILKSVFDADTAKINFELMIQFYQFMTIYIQSDLVTNLTYDGLVSIKTLIDRVADFLQSNLSDELNRINDFILTDEEQKEETANSAQIINIIKYKENMELLVRSIDQFEQELIRLNDMNDDEEIDLLENYKDFVSNLELNVKSRATRFVSAMEIDQILNPKIY